MSGGYTPTFTLLSTNTEKFALHDQIVGLASPLHSYKALTQSHRQKDLCCFFEGVISRISHEDIIYSF